ncbi:hypothetical protein [Aquitalea sp. USM4]|uniref:hypothetical protein n=1 Tax=Aquitalea sp. USM4 TaxID=1590041 RepID=UPI00103FAF70|nr:hypothetical protein [Aquitalea sp. USM4]
MMPMKEKSPTWEKVSDINNINGGVRTLPVLRPFFAPSICDTHQLALNQYRHVELLASAEQQRDNASVLFNSSTGFGDPNIEADSRLAAIFTSVRNTIGAPISMASRGGDTFGYAGTSMPVRQPCHVLATPVWRREASFTLIEEATMPKLSRALSRLFPIAHNIGTAANLAEAQALARLHLARTGHAVRIAPAAVGFTVAEVR